MLPMAVRRYTLLMRPKPGLNDDLYRIKIKNGKVSEGELVDTDVCTDYYTAVLSDGTFIYFKNISKDYHSADLYIDGETCMPKCDE